MQDNEKRYNLELTKREMWLVYRALVGYEDRFMDMACDALKSHQSDEFDQWYSNVDSAVKIENTIRAMIEKTEEEAK